MPYLSDNAEHKGKDTYMPPEMTVNMAKTNKTSVKFLRCLSAPPGGRYLLNAQFKNIVLNECTKELLRKTRDAALETRRPLSDMTEEQIYNISKALLADTKVHLKAAWQYDESLMSKARLVPFKPEELKSTLEQGASREPDCASWMSELASAPGLSVRDGWMGGQSPGLLH